VTLPTVMVCAYADSDSEFTAMLSRVLRMCMENLAVWSYIGAINMERQKCQNLHKFFTLSLPLWVGWLFTDHTHPACEAKALFMHEGSSEPGLSCAC